jgi:hypothetical protein
MWGRVNVKRAALEPPLARDIGCAKPPEEHILALLSLEGSAAR